MFAYRRILRSPDSAASRLRKSYPKSDDHSGFVGTHRPNGGRSLLAKLKERTIGEPRVNVGYKLVCVKHLEIIMTLAKRHYYEDLTWI